MTRNEAERLHKVKKLLQLVEEDMVSAMFLLIDIIETAEREHAIEDQVNTDMARP